jgi:hypothetical protein
MHPEPWMGVPLVAVGVICSIASLVAFVVVLIDAFQDEIWKGLASFLCGLYLIYYAIVEFENDRKGLIVAALFLGGLAGSYLTRAGWSALGH